MTRLMAESGPLRGRIFRLETPIVRVGHAEDNEIVIPHLDLEPVHFELVQSGEQVLLRSNGETKVNEETVSQVALKHGDQISLFAASTRAAPAPAAFAPSDDEPTLPTPDAARQRAVFLAEREVELDFDDVRTVMGTPDARWGSRKKPSVAPKFAPPGGHRQSSAPATLHKPPQWQQRKLEVLLAVGKALSRPEDIEQKVHRVLDLLFDTMDIDRAAALVLGADDDPKTATTFSWSAYRTREGSKDELKLSSTVIQKVLCDAVAVMTQDAQAEDWLDSARSVLGQAIRTCICTPLKTANGVIGVLYADSARTSYPFNQDDMEFFTAFSNQAAVAIENARLLRVALAKERLEQDLRVARRIQRWLYPRHTPEIPGYSLSGESLAMDDVGGDYFDYILLDDHTLALVVADVSGHGISAALVMTMTRSILRGSLDDAGAQMTAADALMRVNRLVSDDMITRMFVTMLLLILDTRTGAFTFANAGHNAPLQYHAASRQIQEVPDQRGKPLGMSRWARVKANYKNAHGQLNPGDALCLYTDGFPEAPNEAGELMEMERFQQTLLQAAPILDAEPILKHLFDGLHQYRGASPVTDDTTAIVLKRDA